MINLTMVSLLILSAAEPEKSEGVAFFEKRIRPILAQHCYECHSVAAKKSRGGLHLDTRMALLKGGDSGSVLVPGDPDKSLLIRMIRHDNDVSQMPPKSKLTDAQVADLVAWVKMGAPDPREGKTVVYGMSLEEGKNFWSLKPIQDPAPPTVKDTNWPANGVDRFILAKLEAANLKPGPRAPRGVLLRRVSFDLTGLPPTPEELDAFLADASPEAWTKAIDRLLASPRYGQRWGRHWLDVARYADTSGNASDYPVPQAHLYRDWIIDAFNRDLPYDQFLREQIAGDLMPGGTDEEREQRTIATGYLAIARRFGGSRFGEHHLTLEDTIDNLGRTMLGFSISCARCHDHKFDPFTMSDYYGLYGIFSSTRYPFPGAEAKKEQEDFVALKTIKGIAYAVAEAKPANARMHLRGDPARPGAEVQRHFPAVLGGQELTKDDTGSGRLKLAEWLTYPKNPLPARVMVNRIWQHHFGKGIVPTPNDFGRQGKAATHPELLDYLASRFIESGWSIKAMHRLILTSKTWQQSSEERVENAKIDPLDELYWKQTRRRLDAESIRDTMLQISGELDESPAGPHPFPEAKTWKFTQHSPFFAIYETKKRSVYLMQQRLRRHPYLALFDGADPSSSTGVRSPSTTPLQALFLMNDNFVHQSASKLAQRIKGAASEDEGRVAEAFRIAYQRPAEPDEIMDSVRFVRDYRTRLKMPADQAEAASWSAFARALLSANEFVYVD